MKKGSYGFDRSIIFFASLTGLIFILFCLGISVNVYILSRTWKQDADRQFVQNSNMLASFISSCLTDKSIVQPITEDDLAPIRRTIHFGQMDVNSRVYLLSRGQTFQIYPDLPKMPPDRLEEQVTSVWLDGWLGKKFVTAGYERSPGIWVRASIIPIPFEEKSPSYIVVVEQSLDGENTTDRMAKTLFVLIGLTAVIFSFVITFAARSMMTPFLRLLSVLKERDTTQRFETPVDHPVDLAIAWFDTTCNELRKKEKELQFLNEKLSSLTAQSDDMHDAILSNTGAGVVTFDADQKIMSISTHARFLLNLGDSRILGEFCCDVFGRGSLIHTLLIEGLVNGRTFVNRHVKYSAQKDAEQWLSITSLLTHNDQGQVIALTFIFRDITESKLLAETMKDQEHLAALGELSAGIAHEIRNPLGAIGGNADYLLTELKDDTLREVAKDIKEEVLILDRIIHDFLKYARPAVPEITSVNIKDFITSILHEVELNDFSAIQLELEASDALPLMQIDESLMRQVFQNLILNSIQAIEGTGKITIRLESSSMMRSSGLKDESVRIIIRDTGKGIEKSDILNVFKPFFTTKPKGTGLGLAIAKRFIVLHNGHIEFDRSVETGAKLVIDLPVTYDPDRTIEM